MSIPRRYPDVVLSSSLAPITRMLDEKQTAREMVASYNLLEIRECDATSTPAHCLRRIDRCEDWAKFFGDSAVVTAMRDRLLHHGHVLKCGPRSWRTKTDLPPQLDFLLNESGNPNQDHCTKYRDQDTPDQAPTA